jgi:hypothetical protein
MSLGNEAVEGSKMGTQLIMFVAIVAIALAAFLVGKNLVNSGLDNMETTVGKVNDSRFSDYNNKVVRGRALKQAIDNFQNEEVAILVNNLAFQGTNKTGSSSVIVSSLGADNVKKTQITQIYTSADGGNTPGDKVKGSTTNGQEATAVYFVNYNAVLGKKVNGKNELIGTNDAALQVSDLYKDSTTGNYVFMNDFAVGENGDIAFYLVTTPLGKKGDAQYVADSASYNASLIKNASGEIMGIVFIQRKIS